MRRAGAAEWRTKWFVRYEFCNINLLLNFINTVT